ncbi:MAG TPA: hypothetical protein VFM21_06185, partial [Terriglobia bacterium]|nr:hypothetical protein [Terriglobia bacterium]
GVFRWFTAGIPLALVTSLAVVCVLAWTRNFIGLRQSLEREMTVFFWKTLAASGLAALAVWGVRAVLPAPLTGFRNFIFLCETCGAGTFIFFATLFALGAVGFSQIPALWKRADSA